MEANTRLASVHAGRKRLFAFAREPLAEASEYLSYVSEQWDGALARLKAFVDD
jgi:hypothetical protein